MDFGLKRRNGANKQPPRRPAGRPARRGAPASADKSARREPRPAADKPPREGEPPPNLWAIIGDAAHGILFLGLMAASLIYFGPIFEAVAAVLLVLSALSLREAWLGWRHYHGK
ncbi:MAG TPA: hypothetical protein VJ770_18570 [Stellaceae bacterium]|nr:hypothetical protein [Stellaceae bacterium]